MTSSYTLYMYISSDDDNLQSMYMNKVTSHNTHVNNEYCADSGFDIFVTENQTLCVDKVNKINFYLRCEMVKTDQNGTKTPSPFYLYPRSSISKSHFRLANNVGIIDSGYRGDLMGMFDVIYSLKDVECESGTRLLQICTPTLEPFKIVIVKNTEELSNTQRGEGGFGSSGGTMNIN